MDSMLESQHVPGMQKPFHSRDLFATPIPARKVMLTPKSAQMPHSGKNGQEFLIMIRALQNAVWIWILEKGGLVGLCSNLHEPKFEGTD